MMNAAVKPYYETLAPTYDANRFGNSYGQYLHRQEVAVLDRYLGPPAGRRVLDLACGTGRLMDYCTDGADISPAMIAQGRRKHRGKRFSVQDALQTTFDRQSFDAIISFHLLMHLDWTDLELFLWEAARLLRPGGRLIFDVPSAERRDLLGHQQIGWHGANAYTDAEVRELLGTTWRLKATRGIAALPVHRLPNALRRPLGRLDDLLCRWPLGRLASYRAYVIEKR